VGSRDGWDVLEKKKVSCPCWNFEYQIIQPVAWSLYQLSFPRSTLHIGIKNYEDEEISSGARCLPRVLRIYAITWVRVWGTDT